MTLLRIALCVDMIILGRTFRSHLGGIRIIRVPCSGVCSVVSSVHERYSPTWVFMPSEGRSVGMNTWYQVHVRCI